MAPKKISRLYYLIPVIGLVLCTVFGMRLLESEYGNDATAFWPTTDGVVIRSEWAPHGGAGCRFSLRFQYAYTAGGKKRSGNNYRYGGECDEQDLERIVTMYPVGAHIVVHYSPADPDQSVISAAEFSSNTQAGMIAIALLLVLFVYLLFFIARSRHRQSAQTAN